VNLFEAILKPCIAAILRGEITSLFEEDDRPGRALSGGFLDQSFERLGDHIHKNPGYEFVLIVLKDLRANLVAVPVSHTQIVVNLHSHVLSPSLSF
jgi:hypothetical protein